MLEQILAGLLPTLWDGNFWQLSHYEIDRRELVLKFAPYRLSKQMIVKVGLGGELQHPQSDQPALFRRRPRGRRLWRAAKRLRKIPFRFLTCIRRQH